MRDCALADGKKEYEDGKKEAEDNKNGAAPYLDAAGWKRLALIMVECIVFVYIFNNFICI